MIDPGGAPISPAGTVLAAPDGQVLMHTPRFAGLVGRAGEDLRGEAVPELLLGLLGRRLTFADLPIMVDGHAGDGRCITFVIERMPNGNCCLSAADVTGAHAVAEALRRARRSAETASKAKSRVLTTISHELRTPLHAVIGFADTLVQPPPGGQPLASEQVREYATAIRDAGQVLLRQINNILDVVRLESGGLGLADDVIELPRLIESALRQCAPAARAAHVALVAVPGDPGRWLRGDERRLRQVLGHLLANAVKFTQQGGTVAVETELADDGDLHLRVRDNGIGIAAPDLERVVDSCHEAATPSGRDGAGVGFGLYFCRAVIEAHGGRLTLASHRGAGTSVTLCLPPARLVVPTPLAAPVSPPDTRLLQESP